MHHGLDVHGHVVGNDLFLLELELAKVGHVEDRCRRRLACSLLDKTETRWKHLRICDHPYATMPAATTEAWTAQSLLRSSVRTTSIAAMMMDSRPVDSAPPSFGADMMLMLTDELAMNFGDVKEERRQGPGLSVEIPPTPLSQNGQIWTSCGVSCSPSRSSHESSSGEKL